MTVSQLSRLKVASSSLLSNSRHHQLLAVLLTLLFVPAATAQTNPSDSEMKEVVRTLLEREVPRSADGGNVAVLLGPNVKSSWIPDVSGFDIRQLSYDEQKLVPEYYDLSSSFKGGVRLCLKSQTSGLDTVSTGSDSDVVSDQHGIFLTILDSHR